MSCDIFTPGESTGCEPPFCAVCNRCGQHCRCDRRMRAAYQFRQWILPIRMQDSLDRYIQEHCPVGDFLSAVIDNNLRAAVCLADDENIQNIPAFVSYLYNEAPGACWGSPEKRKAWLAKAALKTS